MMKRSGNVGLVLMGGATFAATFAAGMAYFAWQKPSHAATPQSAPIRATVYAATGHGELRAGAAGLRVLLLPALDLVVRLGLGIFL